MFEKIKSDLRELDEIEIRKQVAEKVKHLFKKFDSFAHKGNRGHAAIYAGSHGMMGAAILSTKAALRSGVGKVTAIIPERYFDLIHLSAPESLVETNDGHLNFSNYDAIGIGPGLGTTFLNVETLENIFSAKCKLVLDADMLNFISLNRTMISSIPGETILTPHLLEWKRLFGDVGTDRERIMKTMEICSKQGFHVLIKGHISSLITPKGEVFFNSTGNAGMAKGGSGDVLTGLLTGLLAQGYSSTDAGIIGMYIHGLAGDLAKELIGEQAMTPTDQLDQFGSAFRSIE